MHNVYSLKLKKVTHADDDIVARNVEVNLKVRFKKGSSKTAFKESDFVIRTNNEVRASRKRKNFCRLKKFEIFVKASKFFRSLKRSCALRFFANFRCKSNRNGGVDPT